MLKLSNYLRSHITRFFYTLIVLLLILTNITILSFNQRFIQSANNEQNTALVTMVEHLLDATSAEETLLFVAHYSHTHNVYLSYNHYDPTLSYHTPTLPTQGRTYPIYQDNEQVASVTIDNIDSTLTSQNTVFLISANIVIILFFIIGLMTLRFILNKRINTILTDLKHVNNTIKHQMSPAYTFSDFKHLDDTFNQTMHALETLKQNHTKEIQALAHDIKTPLTIINATLESVKLNKTALTDDVTKSILEETTTINNLVLSILKNSDQTHKKPLNITKEIETVITQFVPLFSQKGLEFTYTLEDNVIQTAKPSDFKRITEHLLSNALKYTDSGYVHLSLTKHHLSVKDTGKGLNKDILKNTPSRRDGHGFGLSIVKNIVEANNLVLSINPNSPKGTKLTITFHS